MQNFYSTLHSKGVTSNRDYLISTYAKCSEKLTFLTPDTHMYVCVYQGVRNVSFSENFAHILNE